ncbi:MAG TPA: hypothetical protein ACFYD4_13275 [Candidatus Wunengus sp. YC61]|uniref:hypothetical protein n=1 Tax=Candidatus Wunengus sp. YC61 TaxID=3367698 RepID=UPI004026BD7C
MRIGRVGWIKALSLAPNPPSCWWVHFAEPTLLPFEQLAVVGASPVLIISKRQKIIGTKSITKAK